MAYSLHARAGTRLVVVGGCGGIGRALVEAALGLDLRVVVLDLPASLEAAPPPPGVISQPIDVSDPDSVAAAFAGIGGIDALVNLAGFTNARTPIEELDLAEWNAIVGANLTGTFLVARAALPMLRAAGTPEAPSAIVHAASGLASRLMPGFGPYGASKAGVIALTKALAVECAPVVRANAVAPGAVDTAFLRGGMGRERNDVHLDRARYESTLPMGRIARADDVVGPILFLCGPGSAYMTGQVLWINGGGLTP
jgi:NAD(P)-dependent dehydrogenase (short-subunit alcohol dehydrogenase family)